MEDFIVSARKYRPKAFDTVVGQSHITKTLENAIENNTIAQAMLFCGPRGVGKTTCARILAREINKKFADSDSTDPEFTMNIHELDAASNNSVEDIRALIEQVRFAPASGKYKVYIIDEVHMLSQAAFNAFLKTLEEPPAHSIFILATTEKNKIIPTILSRCQIFDFKRITTSDMREHLGRIALDQGVTASEQALQIIAEKADGALRDALSIFDRVVSFCGKNLTEESVAENLSVIDTSTYLAFTDMIISHNIPKILLSLNDLVARGFDASTLLRGLASHYRDLMAAKDASTEILIDASDDVRKKYAEQAQKMDKNLLTSSLAILSSADINLKLSSSERLLVEITLMQLASLGVS